MINYKITYGRKKYVPMTQDKELLKEFKPLSMVQLKERLNELNKFRVEHYDRLVEVCRKIELVSHLLHQFDTRDHPTFDPRNYTDDHISTFDKRMVRKYVDKSKPFLNRSLNTLCGVRTKYRRSLTKLDQRLDTVEDLMKDRRSKFETIIQKSPANV